MEVRMAQQRSAGQQAFALTLLLDFCGSAFLLLSNVDRGHVDEHSVLGWSGELCVCCDGVCAPQQRQREDEAGLGGVRK